MCFLWLLGGFCALLGSIVSLGLVTYTFQRTAARGEAEEVPEEVVRDVLGLLDAAGAESPGTTLLRPAGEGASTGSRLGGLPHLPAGTPWPGGEGGAPARHLAQVTLASAELPEVWQGRRISVFLGKGQQVSVRSDAAGVPLVPLAAPAGALLLREVPLAPVRLPGVKVQGYTAPWDAVHLVKRVPALKGLLEDYTGKPARVLPYLLVPSLRRNDLGPESLVRVGGPPNHPHRDTCPTCSAPLRFLLSLGDVFRPELALTGDAEVLSVLGCDAHPDVVKAALDG